MKLLEKIATVVAGFLMVSMALVLWAIFMGVMLDALFAVWRDI